MTRIHILPKYNTFYCTRRSFASEHVETNLSTPDNLELTDLTSPLSANSMVTGATTSFTQDTMNTIVSNQQQILNQLTELKTSKDELYGKSVTLDDTSVVRLASEIDTKLGLNNYRISSGDSLSNSALSDDSSFSDTPLGKKFVDNAKRLLKHINENVDKENPKENLFVLKNSKYPDSVTISDFNTSGRYSEVIQNYHTQMLNVTEDYQISRKFISEASKPLVDSLVTFALRTNQSFQTLLQENLFNSSDVVLKSANLFTYIVQAYGYIPISELSRVLLAKVTLSVDFITADFISFVPQSEEAFREIDEKVKEGDEERKELADEHNKNLKDLKEQNSLLPGLNSILKHSLVFLNKNGFLCGTVATVLGSASFMLYKNPQLVFDTKDILLNFVKTQEIITGLSVSHEDSVIIPKSEQSKDFDFSNKTIIVRYFDRGFLFIRSILIKHLGDPYDRD